MKAVWLGGGDAGRANCAGPLWPPGAPGLASQTLGPGVSGHVRPHGGAAGWEPQEGRWPAGRLCLPEARAAREAQCDGPVLALELLRI